MFTQFQLLYKTIFDYNFNYTQYIISKTFDLMLIINRAYFIQTNNVFRYSPLYYKWRTLKSLCFSLQSVPYHNLKWSTLSFKENNLINTSRPTNSIFCWKAPQSLNLLCNPWDTTEIVSYHKKNYIWVKTYENLMRI